MATVQVMHSGGHHPSGSAHSSGFLIQWKPKKRRPAGGKDGARCGPAGKPLSGGLYFLRTRRLPLVREEIELLSIAEGHWYRVRSFLLPLCVAPASMAASISSRDTGLAGFGMIPFSRDVGNFSKNDHAVRVEEELEPVPRFQMPARVRLWGWSLALCY